VITLKKLNLADQAGFVAVCGPLFEHSPWIAERASAARPFSSLAQLHESMCNIVKQAGVNHQLALIRAHPDLVSNLARAGRLTTQSTGEQAAAGLDRLTPDEIARFDKYNTAYRERFGFPFVICARQNRKDAILAAMPIRLQNTGEQEIATALEEIYKIAKLRLNDAVSE
jgi:2-oxo-4-hydroxy-4-carboxy-5-ureidoimidazoline decarboxylase